MNWCVWCVLYNSLGWNAVDLSDCRELLALASSSVNAPHTAEALVAQAQVSESGGH